MGEQGDGTRGQAAERRVHDALRAALQPEYPLYRNARWCARTRLEPTDAIWFETIRRFRGLKREVVVLCELPETGERLDQLLYVGLTRATTQLVVIAPPELSQRLGRISM